jgi:hypothetical protein
MESRIPDEESVKEGTLPDVSEDLGKATEETPPIQDAMTPQTFGTFAHQAYEAHAYETFDDVGNEIPVRKVDADGLEKQGKILYFPVNN